MDGTIDYYDRNAQAYFGETVGADLSAIYDRFLPHLPAGGHILDAGCGSGRDSLHFRNAGYAVTALDASPAMARLARDYLGQPVYCERLERFQWAPMFDGIWACASLLHLPCAKLPDVFARLGAALKPGGVIYASFKLGSQERSEAGRHYTDLDPDAARCLVGETPMLTLTDCWESSGSRSGGCLGQAQPWLNLMLTRTDRA